VLDTVVKFINILCASEKQVHPSMFKVEKTHDSKTGLFLRHHVKAVSMQHNNQRLVGRVIVIPTEEREKLQARAMAGISV